MSKFKENFNFITNIIILSLISLGTLVYAVGFHSPNEVLSGEFAVGNYSFNGSVGIGTSNPQSTLDINGNITISELELYVVNVTDSETVSLIHSNSNDGNTSFIDSSLYTHSITANGEVHHNTSKNRIGSSSIYFDGSGDYLSLPNSVDWQFGSGDYTIDIWVYHTDITGQQTYTSDTYSATNGVYFYKTAAQELGLYYSSPIISGGTITVNTWHHVAVSRKGGMVYLFLDGNIVASTTDSLSLTEQVLTIGDSSGTSSGEMIGFMDEIRVSKGVGRWDSNFNVLTLPYNIFKSELRSKDKDNNIYTLN